jgi:hypothetical protein
VGDLRSAIMASVTGRMSARWRGCLFLALAGSGLALAADAPPSWDLSSALNSPAVSGWTIADFDGNNLPDLATASSPSHDSSGYAQELRVEMSPSQRSFVVFRSRSATVELSTPDIDGDHDQDLVIREPLSMELIGIWINDGAGSFTEANVVDFPSLKRSPSDSQWRATPQSLGLAALSEERVPPAIPAVSQNIPLRTSAPLAQTDRTDYRRLPRFGLHPRAPPRIA